MIMLMSNDDHFNLNTDIDNFYLQIQKKISESKCVHINLSSEDLKTFVELILKINKK